MNSFSSTNPSASCLLANKSNCNVELTIKYFLSPSEWVIAGTNDFYSPTDDTDVKSNSRVNSRRSTSGYIYDASSAKESEIGALTVNDTYTWTPIPGFIHISRTEILNFYDKLMLQVNFPIIQNAQGDLIFPEQINTYDFLGRPCVMTKADDKDQSNRRYWQIDVYNKGAVVF